MTPYSHGGMTRGLIILMEGNYTLLIRHIEIGITPLMLKLLIFKIFLPDACRHNRLEDPICTLNNFQSELRCLPMIV